MIRLTRYIVVASFLYSIDAIAWAVIGNLPVSVTENTGSGKFAKQYSTILALGMAGIDLTFWTVVFIMECSRKRKLRQTQHANN
jgi:hypothetical protein